MATQDFREDVQETMDTTNGPLRSFPGKEESSQEESSSSSSDQMSLAPAGPNTPLISPEVQPSPTPEHSGMMRSSESRVSHRIADVKEMRFPVQEANEERPEPEASQLDLVQATFDSIHDEDRVIEEAVQPDSTQHTSTSAPLQDTVIEKTPQPDPILPTPNVEDRVIEETPQPNPVQPSANTPANSRGDGLDPDLKLEGVGDSVVGDNEDKNDGVEEADQEVDMEPPREFSKIVDRELLYLPAISILCGVYEKIPTFMVYALYNAPINGISYVLGTGALISRDDILFNIWFHLTDNRNNHMETLRQALIKKHQCALNGTIQPYGSVDEVKGMLTFTSAYRAIPCSAFDELPTPDISDKDNNNNTREPASLPIRQTPEWDFNPRVNQARPIPEHQERITEKRILFNNRYDCALAPDDFNQALFCLTGLIKADCIPFNYDGSGIRTTAHGGWGADDFIARWGNYENFVGDNFRLVQCPDPAAWMVAQLASEKRVGMKLKPWRGRIEATPLAEAVVEWEFLEKVEWDLGRKKTWWYPQLYSTKGIETRTSQVLEYLPPINEPVAVEARRVVVDLEEEDEERVVIDLENDGRRSSRLFVAPVEHIDLSDDNRRPTRAAQIDLTDDNRRPKNTIDLTVESRRPILIDLTNDNNRRPRNQPVVDLRSPTRRPQPIIGKRKHGDTVDLDSTNNDGPSKKSNVGLKKHRYHYTSSSSPKDRRGHHSTHKYPTSGKPSGNVTSRCGLAPSLSTLPATDANATNSISSAHPDGIRKNQNPDGVLLAKGKAGELLIEGNIPVAVGKRRLRPGEVDNELDDGDIFDWTNGADEESDSNPKFFSSTRRDEDGHSDSTTA